MTFPSLLARISSALLALSLVAWDADPPRASAQVKVRDQRGIAEVEPAPAAGYFGWSQSRKANPDRFDVFVKPAGKPRVRLNARFANGYTPSIGLGSAIGDVVVFWNHWRSNHDIKVWDLATRQRKNPPGGVNTRANEGAPHISGDHLLFARGPRTARFFKRIVLFDLNTRASKGLAVAPKGGSVYTGGLNGDYAVWESCSVSPLRCNVFRHRIDTDATAKVPSGAKLNFAPTVTADGTVYYMRSGLGCGVRARIMRFVPGDGTNLVHRFRAGQDAADLAVRRAGGKDRVFFSRYLCNQDEWGIYRVAA